MTDHLVENAWPSFAKLLVEGATERVHAGFQLRQPGRFKGGGSRHQPQTLIYDCACVGVGPQTHPKRHEVN